MNCDVAAVESSQLLKERIALAGTALAQMNGMAWP